MRAIRIWRAWAFSFVLSLASAGGANSSERDLKWIQEAIDRGEFRPRSCVASLYLREGINQGLHRRLVRQLRSLGYNSERGILTPEALFRFEANGLLGLKACLEGGYEDVTIFSHALVGVETTLNFEVELGEGGFSDSVPSFLWTRFRTGEYRLHPDTRQVTLANCKADEVLRTDPELASLLHEKGIWIRKLPVDPLVELLTGENDVVTGPDFIARAIAENMQVETVHPLHCLVDSRGVFLLRVGTHGVANCVRGRYRVRLTGLKLGVEAGNEWVHFSPNTERSYNELIGLGLGARGSLDLNLGGSRSFASNSQSYGASLSIGDQTRVQDRSLCFLSDDPLIRLVCQGDWNRVLDQVDLGDDFSAQDRFGNTMAHAAVVIDDVDVLAELRNREAPMDIPNEDGVTPIGLAVLLGRYSLVGYLLEWNEEQSIRLFLNRRDENGNTLLHYMIPVLKAENGRREDQRLVRSLVLSGINFERENDGGESFYELLQGIDGMRDLKEFLRRIKEL